MSHDSPSRPSSSPERARERERQDSPEPGSVRGDDATDGSSRFSDDDEDDDFEDDTENDYRAGNAEVGEDAPNEDGGPAGVGPANTRTGDATEDDTDFASSSHRQQPSPPTPTPERRRRRRRRRQEENMKKRGLRKKLRFLTDLLTCLDSLVFMELGAFYYLECSLWRFCMRAILHYIFLTPKSESFPFLMPAAQSHIVSIFLPNTLCFLLHLFGSLPHASRDIHRGYLHGGVLADFIGQKPPTSRFPLLFLDCVILLVQCLMLAVHSDREELRGSMRKFIPFGSGNNGTGRQGVVGLGLGRLAVADDFAARTGARSQTPPTRQATVEEQDAAERGEGGDRSQERQEGDAQSSGEDESEEEEHTGADEDTPRDNAGDETPGPHESSAVAADALLHDLLSSGLGVLGEFNIVHTLRTASMDFESAAAHSLRTLGYTATLTALAARRGSVPVESPRPNNPGSG